MGKEIEVIFTQNKKGSFTLGQRKKVKAGYAINYLLPYDFAILNTPGNQTKIDSITKKATKDQAALKKVAQELHASIHKKEVVFIVKTHDEGKLYGSIKINELVDKINSEYKTEIDKFDIKQFPLIKTAGTYPIEIVIHEDISTEILVIVESEPEEKIKTSSTGKTKKKEKSTSSIKTYADDIDDSQSEDKSLTGIADF